MSEFLHDGVSFIVAISILVAFHEFGHFWVARRFGIKVLRYSVGFGKPLWRRVGRDGVDYRIGSIPLGGYVKLLDEREGEVAPADLPRAFNRQPVLVRIAVFFAGPAFNFVLAVVFFWAMYLIGVPSFKSFVAQPAAGTAAAAAQLQDGDRVVAVNGAAVDNWDQLQTDLLQAVLLRHQAALTVQPRQGAVRQVSLDLGKVRSDPQYLFDDLGLSLYEPPVDPVFDRIVPGSPADQAGLKAGDRVLSIDGLPISDFKQLQQSVRQRGGQVVKLEVQRGGERLTIAVIPATLTNEQGKSYVGIGAVAANGKLWQDLQTQQRYGPVAAVPMALRQTWDTTVMVVEFVYHMVLGDISIKNISGPINTAQVAGVSASIGLWAFLHFIAVVSLNLGIVNLLPVPLLDGGQILYGLVELVKGSPLSERAQAFGQQVGLTLLVMLMGLAFYNDLARFIG